MWRQVLISLPQYLNKYITILNNMYIIYIKDLISIYSPKYKFIFIPIKESSYFKPKILCKKTWRCLDLFLLLYSSAKFFQIKFFGWYKNILYSKSKDTYLCFIFSKQLYISNFQDMSLLLGVTY